MATVLEDRKRGRKKGALRTTAEALAATVGIFKGKAGDEVVTVELLPAEGDLVAETVEITIPKGTVVVPFDLTLEKSDENAREQIRKGASEDAGADIAIRSVMLKLDRVMPENVGQDHPLWLLTPGEGEAAK